jgi:hypothetical protein
MFEIKINKPIVEPKKALIRLATEEEFRCYEAYKKAKIDISAQSDNIGTKNTVIQKDPIFDDSFFIKCDI